MSADSTILEELEDFKQVETILLSSSKEGLNKHIEIIIYNYKHIIGTNFYKLEIIFGNKKCNQFIIKKEDFIENNNIQIRIKLKNIRLKMINSINYLEIKNYDIINKKIILYKNINLFEFNLPKIIQNYKPNDSVGNLAIKLKSKEKDLISSFTYNFYDILNNEIKIESLDDEFLVEIEYDKIYLFNGFNYNSKKNSLNKINISSIQIIDKKTFVENIEFIDNIENIENNKIINFKGNIKDLMIETFEVIIEETHTKKEIKANVNLNLIKKINPSYECQFINFKKVNDVLFTISEFSDIYSNDDTIVELTFLDYSSKYYNRIKVDNSYIDINEEKIIFRVEADDKSDIFEQKFIYEMVNSNEQIVKSYEFTLEMNKRKINYFVSFLKEAGGYTYQLYFQSKEKGYSPTSIKVKTEGDNFIYLNHFENLGNNLKKRITIINANKQNFTNLYSKEFNLDENEVIKNDQNLKIYYLIKENHNNNNNFIYENNNIFGKNEKFFIFDLKIDDNIGQKEYFKIDKEENLIINDLYDKYKQMNFNLDISKINKLFEKREMKKYFEKGFQKYIFNNTKNHYIIIKKLSFLYLYYLFDNQSIRRNAYISRLEEIINKIDCTEYLHRIQIILYFLQIASSKKPLDEFYIIDIYEEKRNEYNNYKACFNAFRQFFKIIDNQNENSSFHQAIHQFNSKLKNDRIRNILMYSGTILSLKDIKFELIKTINRFCFINMRNKYPAAATFSPKSKIIAFYPMSYMVDEEFNSPELIKRISTSFLFLIFHELGGHFKTHLNNIILSPFHFIDDNLNLIYKEFNKRDSGNIFEYILTGHIINPKKIIKSEGDEELFDLKYYIQPNFNDLKQKLNNLSSNIFEQSISDNTSNKTKKFGKFEKNKKNKIEKLPDWFMERLNEAEKNLNDYNYHSLFPLFEIPQGISRSKFDELLKDNIVYKKFLKCLPPDDYRY